MADVLRSGTEPCAGGGDDYATPVPHGRSAGSAVRRARERLEEDLRYLAKIEDELSSKPGTTPERNPEFWLGLLRGTAAYLLWTLREQDKVIHGQG
jgi:hypothetical protein